MNNNKIDSPLMSNKAFETMIQQWVVLDNQMKLLQEKTKVLREQKQLLNKKLVEYNEKYQQQLFTNNTINISDGKLKFVNTKVASPITYKFLEKSLGEIIPNENQVKQIMNHFKERREIKVIQEIKRF